MKSPDASLDALQRELEAVGSVFTKLTSDIDKLRRRVDQLSALRTAEPAEGVQLQALERVLDIDRVAQHARAACAAAELSAGPVPHLVISDVFPGDVYAAIVEAIPEPAFFEAVTDNAYQLRVPPRLAPFQALVTWEFVTAVVLRAFSPALLARLHEPLAAFARTQFPALPSLEDWNVEVTLSQGHIVKRCPAMPALTARIGPGTCSRRLLTWARRRRMACTAACWAGDHHRELNCQRAPVR